MLKRFVCAPEWTGWIVEDEQKRTICPIRESVVRCSFARSIYIESNRDTIRELCEVLRYTVGGKRCSRQGETLLNIRGTCDEKGNQSARLERRGTTEECGLRGNLDTNVGGAQGGGTTLLKAVFEGREYEGERCGARLGRLKRENCEVTLEVDESMQNGTQGERYGSDG
jgi:hypothetical protein